MEKHGVGREFGDVIELRWECMQEQAPFIVS